MYFRSGVVAVIAMVLISVASPAQCGPKEIADIAGKAVAGITREMHLFYVPPSSDIADDARQLFKVLTDNDLKGIFLILGSEDSAMTVAVIRRVFPRITPGSLAGCRIIFVGSTADRDVVAAFVRLSGADFVFAEYREPGVANEPYTIDLSSGRHDFGFMKVKVPPGWFIGVEQGKAVFVTKQDISVEKQYTTGLSVNMIKDVSKQTSKKASEYARELISYFSQKYADGGIEESSSGALQSFSSILRSKTREGGVIVQYTMASGNNRTGTVFAIIFESPEAEWDEAWKIGQALLKSLTINDNF